MVRYVSETTLCVSDLAGLESEWSLPGLLQDVKQRDNRAQQDPEIDETFQSRRYMYLGMYVHMYCIFTYLST